MFRLTSLLTILLGLSFIFSCGITEPEVPEIQIEENDAITSLAKNNGIDFRTVEIYGFLPASSDFRVDVLKKNSKRVISRVFNIKHVVIALGKARKLYKIEGSIDSFIMEQNVKNGKNSVGRLWALLGDVSYKEIANTYLNSLQSNGLGKSSDEGCQTNTCPPLNLPPYYNQVPKNEQGTSEGTFGGGESACELLLCAPPTQN